MKNLLQGDLSFISAQELLEWLETHSKTGTVDLAGNNSRSSIYLKEGKIIYAASEGAGRRLGEFMVARGVLNEPDLQQALAESQAAGKTLNRHLIDAGLVTIQTLTNLFNRLVLQILAEAFTCRTGSFSFTSPLPANVLQGPVFYVSGRKLSEVFSEIQSAAKEEAIEKLNRRLRDDDIRLPVLPKVATQLRKLLEDENATMQSMTRVIMSDQIIASGVLKVANSPFYAASGPTDSVNLAVARIGTKTALAVVTAIELKAMHLPDVPKEKLETILDNALKSAFIASGLAMQCYLDPEQAFLGGLLHDLGKTVILSISSGIDVDSSLLEEFMNERHAEIGAIIASRWNYPEALQDLIRCHHDPISADTDRTIAALQLADGLIEHGPEWQAAPELLQFLGLDQSSIQDVCQVALQAVGEFSTPPA
ncbi:MAG: HDOD domain-containing protein [Nitrospirota bacterium]|nr:HDOD domain-containing protein [Nitrospirota bacterium]